jgi:protein-tyrosine phosphatase
MADVVLTQRVDDAGLAGRVTVSSCGTGDWHVGQPMDERAAATLRAGDYDPSRHRARQFDPTWLESNDLVLAMDDTNLADVRRADPAVPPDRVRLFGDFDPVEPGGVVPDPYYGGEQGFEEVLAMVERTCAVLVASLQRLPGLGDARPTGPTGPATS